MCWPLAVVVVKALRDVVHNVMNAATTMSRSILVAVADETGSHGVSIADEAGSR